MPRRDRYASTSPARRKINAFATKSAGAPSRCRQQPATFVQTAEAVIAHESVHRHGDMGPSDADPGRGTPSRLYFPYSAVNTRPYSETTGEDKRNPLIYSLWWLQTVRKLCSDLSSYFITMWSAHESRQMSVWQTGWSARNDCCSALKPANRMFQQMASALTVSRNHQRS